MGEVVIGNAKVVISSLLMDEDAAKKRSEAISAISSTRGLNRAAQQAMDSHPKLFVLECVCERYLNASNGDSVVAARHISDYWEERELIWGATNCFLPMTATGHGAISATDSEVLKSGFISVLPRDKNGRSVVCCDTGLLNRDFATTDHAKLMPSIRRCMFYVLSTVSTASNTSEAGVLLLVVQGCINGNTEGRCDLPLPCLNSLVEFIKRYSISSVTIEVAVVDKPASFSDHTRFIESTLAIDPRCNVSRSSSKQLITKMLESRGLSFSGIPSALGGGWSYHAQFAKWRRDRVPHEELLEATLIGDLTSTKIKSIIEKDATRKRKRSSDAAYARRKRRQEKTERDHLDTLLQGLTKERVTLRQEETRLQSLLLEAIRVVRDYVINVLPRLVTGPISNDNFHGLELTRPLLGSIAGSGLWPLSSLNQTSTLAPATLMAQQYTIGRHLGLPSPAINTNELAVGARLQAQGRPGQLADPHHVSAQFSQQMIFQNAQHPLFQSRASDWALSSINPYSSSGETSHQQLVLRLAEIRALALQFQPNESEFPH